MNPANPGFREGNLASAPIRSLGLKIEGTRLEPIIREFEQELRAVGIERVRPKFYLSTEWGVPTDTTLIAIPFYLARPDLTSLHEEHHGFVEGISRWDVLRYLRHEMGHVINYAYRLFEREEWVKLFGSITQPYVEHYQPQPFSRRFVVHLPGWYAQKHPDEDWSETFAVWMTPDRNWRQDYADWPEALAKLNYCDEILRGLRDQDPAVMDETLDEDVSELDASMADLYGRYEPQRDEFPRGLDGSLTSIFEDYGRIEDTSTSAERLPAAGLFTKLERDLMADVFRWTGHFPEQTQRLVRHLKTRAEELKQVYPADRELAVATAVSCLVCALAMNYVHRGTYLS